MALKKVEHEVDNVTKRIEAVEMELKGAMTGGDQEEIKYWREEKRLLMKEKEQLRKEKEQLRDKELKLLDLQSKEVSPGALWSVT